MYEWTPIYYVAMEKGSCVWGAATSGVYGFWDHEAPIAIIYYLPDRLVRSSQAHYVVALLHEVRQGEKVWDEFEAR
jgi:hypothetical protein